MKNRAVIVIVAVCAAVLLAVIVQYNGLVRLREDVRGAWAQTENQLQRRNDLIPNYVNTVKGYARHEEGVYTEVAEARSRMQSAGNMNERAAAEADLTSALGRLMVVVENYPVLKADQNFIRLQDELAGTENRIAVERKRYNDLVNAFNKRVQLFPTNLFARLMGFEKMEFITISEAVRQVPKADFE